MFGQQVKIKKLGNQLSQWQLLASKCISYNASISQGAPMQKVGT